MTIVKSKSDEESSSSDVRDDLSSEDDRESSEQINRFSKPSAILQDGQQPTENTQNFFSNTNAFNNLYLPGGTASAQQFNFQEAPS
jgi:hypothetical protein